MNVRHNGVGICVFVTLGLAACGQGLADEDFVGKPLATLRGQVTNEAGLATGASVRASLIWYVTEGEGLPTFSVTQSVEVQAQFPAAFEIAINDLPPAEVLSQVPEYPDRRYAFGTVVVYTDQNGNGGLDLPVDPLAPIPEPIIGVREELWISYLEGAEIPATGDMPFSMPSGFSQMHTRPFTEMIAEQLACTSQFGAPGREAELDACLAAIDFSVTLAPIDAAFDIPLSTEPQLPYMICGQILGREPNPLLGVDFGTPIIECAPDGRSYYAFAQPNIDPTATLALCLDMFSAYPTAAQSLGPNDPVPAGWPCAVSGT